MANAKMVHCRYPKCSKLHESTELKKEDAVKAGGKNSYYHPDCYHMAQTVNQIKDTFIKEINPMMTGQQIGMLVSTINNIVFGKNVEVDFLKFVVDYFIKYKPGALKYPAGLHYIIQDKDATAAWEKEKARNIREKLKAEIQKSVNKEDKGEISELDLNFGNGSFAYKPQNRTRFSNVLGV